MSGPLEGLKVVDFGMWVAGPAASGIMADWGADVIKIEPANGDPMRGVLGLLGADLDCCPPFELDNRGKRSISLNVSTPEGAALVRKLVAEADIFVTNIRGNALRKAGLDWDRLSADQPRLIYGHVTGYGETGEEADRPAYDVGAFWARGGVAAALTPPGGAPPIQRGGMGDHTAALALLCGVLAALQARERTGQGDYVTTSLLRTSTYFLGFDLNTLLRTGTKAPLTTRKAAMNPLMASYQAGDGHWFWLLGLETTRHWPAFCRVLGKPEWIEKYADVHRRTEDRAAIIEEADAVFRTRTRDQWGELFDRDDVWWAPVQTMEEVLEDPQIDHCGATVEVPLGDGTSARMIAPPADFHTHTAAPAGPAPEVGQNSEEILLELGFDWDQIGKLREAGILT